MNTSGEFARSIPLRILPVD